MDICGEFAALSADFWVLSPAIQDDFLRQATELYRAELEWWDAKFARLWNAMDARGALDDTLVVFVTDHGEQWAEHGAFGHGNTLHAQENRSTGAFWARNLQPTAYTAPTVHQDIAATLYELYGLTSPIPMEGMVVGTAPSDRATYQMSYWGWEVQVGIVKNGKQLQYEWYGGRRFYDLSADPENLVDIYSPTDPGVIDLWGHLQDVLVDIQTEWTHLPSPVNPGP